MQKDETDRPSIQISSQISSEWEEKLDQCRELLTILFAHPTSYLPLAHTLTSY